MFILHQTTTKFNFGKKWGRHGSGCFGNGGVLTCIHHLPLFSVHEVTLNIFIITIKIRYLRLTFAYTNYRTMLSYPFVHLCSVVRLNNCRQFPAIFGNHRFFITITPVF